MTGRFGPIWSAAVSVAVGCAAALGLFPGPGAGAFGQTMPPFPPHPIPESERWATITHAGNAPFVYENGVGAPVSVGRVDHEYQIMRAEVTYGEWYEFVLAYSQFITPQFANYVAFTGPHIFLTGPGIYTMTPGQSNKGVKIGWRYAARYANWLHNGKALTPEAFESGAYDTSTFGDIPGVGFADQQTRSPDATYLLDPLRG